MCFNHSSDHDLTISRTTCGTCQALSPTRSSELSQLKRTSHPPQGTLGIWRERNNLRWKAKIPSSHHLHHIQRRLREPQPQPVELKSLSEDVPAGCQRLVPRNSSRIGVKRGVPCLYDFEARSNECLVNRVGGDHIREPVALLSSAHRDFDASTARKGFVFDRFEIASKEGQPNHSSG